MPLLPVVISGWVVIKGGSGQKDPVGAETLTGDGAWWRLAFCTAVKPQEGVFGSGMNNSSVFSDP